MQSTAQTVDEYLASLADERREVVSMIRQVILDNLPAGYEEGMQYGGIGYYVPHSIFPQGYHCDPKQPLNFAGLGSQKNYISLGFMCTHYDQGLREWLQTEWCAAGKKLDMGTVCIRVKKIDDVPLEVIGNFVAMVPVDRYLDTYLAFRASAKSRAKK